MRIAVTGGSGFIGTYVVDRLLDAGHDVRSLDLVPGPPDPRAQPVTVDVSDLPALVAAFSDCDAVFHLAGMSNVDLAVADPLRTIRLNVEGTGNVCEAARRCGVGRVLFASTVWVYGAMIGDDDRVDTADGLAESAPLDLTRVDHLYTSTKIAAELLLHSYQKTYGLPFTIMRYGIPYGPGMRDELALARFVSRAAAGQPLTVAGDGRQVRNYVFVRDLAEANVLALGPAAENTTIAIEGSQAVSVLGMAQAVRDHFPGATIEHVAARPGDFRGRAVSGRLAADLLGWRPTTSLADGVRQYVDWFLANRAPAVKVEAAAE